MPTKNILEQSEGHDGIKAEGRELTANEMKSICGGDKADGVAATVLEGIDPLSLVASDQLRSRWQMQWGLRFRF